MPRSSSSHPNPTLGPVPLLLLFWKTLVLFCDFFFIYCAKTRMPATPSLTRYLLPPSQTRTHRLPPFRRAVATAGASSMPTGHSLLATSRQPPSSGADTCRMNCGRGRVDPGVEFCRCSGGLWVAGGSGHTHGPFSGDSASPVVTVVAGVGGPVLGVGGTHASCRLLVRGSRGFTFGAPSSHILGTSVVGPVAGPSGHVHVTVCCRHRIPSASNARVLWLTCAAGTSVRTTDGSSALAWWTSSSSGCGIGCAVDSSLGVCSSGRRGSAYRGVGGRAGLHGGRQM
ncbi:uncharacterized protein [Drosophila suzukii]|uniref:Uncharacterized protein n=1 Tax=Drosophila suzukii TaxID=28584 RepID=A0ABM4TZC4_DROSZ